MIIALTGLSGFVGRAFARYAVARGHRVRALVRDPSRVPEELLVRCEIVVGDLSSAADSGRRLLRGAEAFVHLAAAGVQAPDRDWALTSATNIQWSLQWLQQAVASDVSRAVLAGSNIEYAGYGILPTNPWISATAPPAVNEGSPLEPIDPYAATKAAGGIVLRSFARHERLPLTYLRFAQMYGEGDHQGKVLVAAVAAARTGSRFEMTLGEQVREWLYLEDAIRALLTATERPANSVEVMNVGTGVGLTLRHVVKTVWTLAHGDPLLIQLGAKKYRRDEFQYIVMDCSKAFQILGWRASTDLATGIANVLASVH